MVSHDDIQERVLRVVEILVEYRQMTVMSYPILVAVSQSDVRWIPNLLHESTAILTRYYIRV